MENSTITAIAAGSAALLLYKKYRSKFANDNKKYDYIFKGTPGAQEEYMKQFAKEELTKEEKEELSWKFLYDITDIVLNKFTEEDQKTLLDLGKALLKYKMQYEHVVTLGLKIIKDVDIGQEVDGHATGQQI
jgi:tRNA G37 N-methylase Trm5